MKYGFDHVICLPEVHDGNVVALCFKSRPADDADALAARAAADRRRHQAARQIVGQGHQGSAIRSSSAQTENSFECRRISSKRSRRPQPGQAGASQGARPANPVLLAAGRRHRRQGRRQGPLRAGPGHPEKRGRLDAPADRGGPVQADLGPAAAPAADARRAVRMGRRQGRPAVHPHRPAQDRLHQGGRRDVGQLRGALQHPAARTDARPRWWWPRPSPSCSNGKPRSPRFRAARSSW